MKEEIKACQPKSNPSWTLVVGNYATWNPDVGKSITMETVEPSFAYYLMLLCQNLSQHVLALTEPWSHRRVVKTDQLNIDVLICRFPIWESSKNKRRGQKRRCFIIQGEWDETLTVLQIQLVTVETLRAETPPRGGPAASQGIRWRKAF